MTFLVSSSSSLLRRGNSSTAERIVSSGTASFVANCASVNSIHSQLRLYYNRYSDGRGDRLGYGGASGSFTPSDELVGEDGLWDDGPAGYEWKSRVLKERRSMALDYMGDVRKRVPIHNAIRMRARMNKERLMGDLDNPHGHLKAMRSDDKYDDFYSREDGANAGSSAPQHEQVHKNRRGPTMTINDDSPAAVLTEALRASHYNPALDASAPAGSDTAARLAVSAAKDPVTRSMLSGVRASATDEEKVAHGRQAVRDAIDLVEEELEDMVADEGVLEALSSIPPEDLRELRHEFFGGAPDTKSHNKDTTDEMLRQWLKLRKDSSMYHAYLGVPADERKEWSAWYLRDIQTQRPFDE